MKKFKFLALILSLMLLLCSLPACNSNTLELSVMSFNIKIPGDQGVRQWGSRKAAVMDTINNSGADIIGLQEVSSTPYSDFGVLLASHYKLVYFQEPENLAIIYDTNKFNLLSKEHYWLSETPDVRSNGWGEASRRMAAVLMLEHKETGETIKVVNTHGPLNDAANEKAFELIANRSLSGENEPFTVMTGDFNATPNKLGYVPIAEKLQDCRLAAKESVNRESVTYNAWGGKGSIIDYCFVSNSKTVEVLTYQVRDERWGDGNYISDHFAVQVQVRIKIAKDKNA